METLEKKASVEGLEVNNYLDAEQQEKLLKAILRLYTSRNGLSVIEIIDENNGSKQIIIVSGAELEEQWLKELQKKKLCNENLSWTIVHYGVQDKNLDELIDRLKVAPMWKGYKEKWLEKWSVAEGDSDEKIVNFLLLHRFPIANDKGHLFLTEDTMGNTLWAYPMRNNGSGTFSYRIYRRDAIGRTGMSCGISPAEVSQQSGKIGKCVLNFIGKFTERNAIEASERLWLWDLDRGFQLLEKEDDYDLSDIRDFLHYFIWENVGRHLKIDKDEHEPVYVHEIKGNIQVGIWAEDMKYAFQMEGIEMKVSDWLNEAKSHGWIIPTPMKKRNGEIGTRTGYNPSDAVRKLYKRKNKNERVYLVEMPDEEKQKLFELYKIAKMEGDGTINLEEVRSDAFDALSREQDVAC